MIVNAIIIAVTVCITVGIVASIITRAAERFVNTVWLPYKNAIYDNDFAELLSILKLIINTEIEEYENDVFMSKQTISNANFDQFYKDINEKIRKNISPSFEQQMLKYVSEKMLYTTIARSVKKYLTEKIHGTL